MHLRYPSLFVLLLSSMIGAGAGGCADDPVDEEEGVSEDQLSQLPASSILGSIAYGESKELMIATNSYRAWKFTGAAGDDVTAKVAVTLPRLAGFFIVDSSFKTLASATPTPGALELTASAKLPAAGTYYVVFRHTSTKPVMNRVTLEKGGAVSVGLTPSATLTTEDDGYARVTWPGRAGQRFRVMLSGGGNSSDLGASAALTGCATKNILIGRAKYAVTEVEVTSSGTCTIKAGSADRRRRSFGVAIVGLEDPERAAYVKSLECDGPEIPLSQLANAMPEGTNRMYLQPRDNVRGRKRSCNPATGCSPYQPLVGSDYLYVLTTTNSTIKLTATDEPRFEYDLTPGQPSAYGRQDQMVRVKVSPGCLSLTTDAPDRVGQDHVVRFDLPDAARTPDVSPALAPVCTGAPLTHAQALQLFAPGTSTRSLDLEATSATRTCNRLTGCQPWGPVSSAASSLDLRVTSQGQVEVRSNQTWLSVQDGLIVQNGAPVGKITSGCVDITVDSEAATVPSSTDGGFKQQRTRRVGAL